MFSQARVPTFRPGTYLKRLCRHFKLKVPVEFNEGIF